MGKRRNNSEGTITKREDGRWEARVSLPDGKRKCYYGKSKEEVQKKLKQAIRDVDSGLPPPNDKETVEQYLTAWLATVKHQVKTSSFHCYDNSIRIHVVPSLGKHHLSKLTPQHVQQFYTQKLESGLSSTTVRQIHLILHRALKDAQRMGMIQRNVTEMVRPPRTRKVEMKTLDERQAALFVEAANGERLEALFVLAITTGMRQGELLGLRWQDVDIDKGILHVRQALYISRGIIYLTEPKTKNSRRTIHLTKVAIYALRKYRIQYLQEAMAFGPDWNTKYNLMFPTSTGNPIRAAHLVSLAFHRILKNAGLPTIRFHDLRHTAATLMLEKGVNPKMVSEMLGHSDISITLGIYGHVTPRMQQMAIDVLDNMFG
ncbi:MAG: tyrosine-type recombinase/integrase [Ktedonobacteraceae bacterium]|nr:tyrosine-type recombinase/integrase [Ktedonobacteraceae bacterium]MBA3823503.1 tyrosine-type recombinase/integrase [Ktedonobacterales bacterium]